jgi:N-methylhydantoinase A/oxoprolinase/acetone carboxylase beta subunit
MKSAIGKFTAGIGYGFLFGAAAGLTAGVIADNLFFWIIIGVVAGVLIGCAAALGVEARSRSVKRRFEQSKEVQDADQADTLEP